MDCRRPGGATQPALGEKFQNNPGPIFAAGIKVQETSATGVGALQVKKGSHEK